VVVSFAVDDGGKMGIRLPVEGMDEVSNRELQVFDPAVSVVIPAFQAHEHIQRALESVFAQSFRKFEVIVVNDGSPNTELLEQALHPYRDRIRYMKQENRGPSGARNAAVLAARGPYIAFLDSDDVWFPNHLAEQMRRLEADLVLDLIYADSVLVRGECPIGHAFGSEPQSPPVTFEALLREKCTVGTSSTVARREALIEAGLFDERFRRCEDFDLWLRMAFGGSKMDFRTDPGVYHYLTEHSLSSDNYLLKRARIEVYEKTAATLAITEQQRGLIRSLVDKTEAECQKDQLRRQLEAGNYGGALDAAVRARSLSRRNWKLDAAVIGLRWLPGIFRIFHRLHRWWIETRTRNRWDHAARKLTTPPRPTQVH
jgi:GT2 family glycosyltransferase